MLNLPVYQCGSPLGCVFEFSCVNFGACVIFLLHWLYQARLLPNYIHHMWTLTEDGGLAASMYPPIPTLDASPRSMEHSDYNTHITDAPFCRYGPNTVSTTVRGGHRVRIKVATAYPFEEAIKMSIAILPQKQQKERDKSERTRQRETRSGGASGHALRSTWMPHTNSRGTVGRNQEGGGRPRSSHCICAFRAGVRGRGLRSTARLCRRRQTPRVTRYA
eukprot:COSAG05_NODE_1023_length_6126_cov_6.196117_3_plen_219_part_00